MVLFNFINPLYYSLAWTVTHATWQIMVIVLIAAIAQAGLQNQSATARYRILLAAMAMILLASLSTFIYYFNSSAGVMVNAGVNEISGISSLNALDDLANKGETMGTWTIQRVSIYVNEHIYFIVLVWLVGMVLALLRLIGNVGYVFYLRNNMNFPVESYWENTMSVIAKKLHIHKTIDIVESALVRTPIVIGHLKPMILFPLGAINRLNPDEVEAILAHELAHISRNDYLLNIFINLVESLYYFHPALWWLSSQIRLEREHCCDDLAIGFTGSPIKYAKSLVAVQEMAMYSPRLAMAFAGTEKRSQLFIRVNRMLKQSSRAINAWEKGFAGMVIFLLVWWVAMAATPLDNAAHCLPANMQLAGDPRFLKYINENVVDSLEIEFEVMDGTYNYSDHVHDVVMVVANRHVVSFNLNGLEIAGSDISRFERLITDILLERQDTEPPASPAEAHEPEDAALYNAFIEQMKKDKLLSFTSMNQIHFSHRNMVVNDIILSSAIHQQYAKLYEKVSGKKFKGDTGISFEVILDEEGNTLEERISGPNKQSQPQHNAGITTSYSYAESDMPEGINADEMDRRAKEAAFDAWLDKTLIADGYIKNKLRYSILWNQQYMTVDGMEVDASDIKKYAAMMKKMTGISISPSFIKTRQIN
ncbi:MAG: M56 family metallopeptidase [Saprospiraceae bacterium]|nr:M56 family metallopeptidase [Saprospiraceae bacterium]